MKIKTKKCIWFNRHTLSHGNVRKLILDLTSCFTVLWEDTSETIYMSIFQSIFLSISCLSIFYIRLHTYIDWNTRRKINLCEYSSTIFFFSYQILCKKLFFCHFQYRQCLLFCPVPRIYSKLWLCYHPCSLFVNIFTVYYLVWYILIYSKLWLCYHPCSFFVNIFTVYYFVWC